MCIVCVLEKMFLLSLLHSGLRCNFFLAVYTCRSYLYLVAQPTRLSPSPRDILHASPHYFPAVCYGVFYPRGPAPRGRRVQTIPRVSHTRIAHAKVHRAPCSPLSTFSAGLYMAPKPPSPNPRFLRFHQLLYVRIFHR